MKWHFQASISSFRFDSNVLVEKLIILTLTLLLVGMGSSCVLDIKRITGPWSALRLCLRAVTWLTRLPPGWLEPTESCWSGSVAVLQRHDLQPAHSKTPQLHTFPPGMSIVCVLKTRCFLRQVFPGLPAAMQRRYTLDVSAPLLRTQGYVDGRWVSAASEFPVLDPATGKEIARVSDCGPAEAKQAVDAAYKAFHSWKQRSAKVCSPLSCQPNSIGKSVN